MECHLCGAGLMHATILPSLRFSDGFCASPEKAGASPEIPVLFAALKYAYPLSYIQSYLLIRVSNGLVPKSNEANMRRLFYHWFRLFPQFSIFWQPDRKSSSPDAEAAAGYLLLLQRLLLQVIQVFLLPQKPGIPFHKDHL